MRVHASDGAEFTFTPSLRNVACLGTPCGIVELFASLHGPGAEDDAAFVLNVLCDQPDPAALTGWRDLDGSWHDGEMPRSEQVVIARRLMHHGIIGKAAQPGSPDRAGAPRGRYAQEFNAAEFVSFARVHLGLGSADAEALSMTELHQMVALKFPDKSERDVPTREEYDEFMRRVMRKGSTNG